MSTDQGPLHSEQEENEYDEDDQYDSMNVDEVDNTNTSQPKNDGTAEFELYLLCKQAGGDEEDDEDSSKWRQSWDNVRNWLHQNENVSEQAIMEHVENGTTALHFACRNAPPADVIEHMLTIAPKAIELTDKFGWTALHYSCANNASEDVIRVIVSSHPESTTAQTERGLTPLHFALGNKDVPPSLEAMTLLASFGATSSPDKIGMVVCFLLCPSIFYMYNNTFSKVTQNIGCYFTLLTFLLLYTSSPPSIFNQSYSHYIMPVPMVHLRRY